MTPLPLNPTPKDYRDRIFEGFEMMLNAEHIIANMLDNYIKATRSQSRWHDGSELPDNPDKDTIYLAIGINNKPFLTHWWTKDIWLKTVVMWQYIDIPTNTPS